jgi:hypothetical protein
MESTNNTDNDANNALVSQGKVGHKGWNIISSRVPEHTQKFLQYAYDYTRYDTDQFKQTNDLLSCGEELYLLIRNILVDSDLKLVKKADVKAIESSSNSGSNNSSNSSKSTKKGKTNKKSDIIEKNKTSKIMEEFTNLHKNLLSDVRTSIEGRVGYNSSYVEFRLIALMASIRKIIKMESYKITDGYFDRANDTVIGSKKIHKQLLGTSTTNNTSATCLEDLSYWIEKLEKRINFTIRDAMINYGTSIISTHLDGLIPQFKFKLYQSQIDVIETLKANEQVLILYMTMNGSGKTSSLIPICGYITKNNSSITKFSRKKILFCCPSKLVRMSVANYCYSIGIPFAIVSMHESAIKYDYNAFVAGGKAQESKDDNTCLLYIADPYISYKILATRCQKGDEMLLFMDEMTMGADQPGNLVTDYFVRIMSVAPSQTILASATMPKFDELPDFYCKNKLRYPELKVVTINSHETKIGSKLFNLQGDVFVPHQIEDIDHKEQLIKVNETINQNPFLGRFYRASTIWNMHDSCVEIGTDVNVDVSVDEFFKDPSNWNQISIQKMSYDVLDAISKTDDSIIDKFCHKAGQTGAGIDSIDTNTTEKCEFKLDLSTILTKDAHRFLGGCIVACDQPFNLGMHLAKEAGIIENAKFTQVLKQFNQLLDVHNASRDRILVRTENPSKQSEQMAELGETFPKWSLPNKVQINTSEHLVINNHPELRSFGRHPVLPLDLPIESSKASQDLLCLLACGIGFYSLTDQYLDQEYLDAVIALAFANKLSFIFADVSLAYGANIPINNIIIVDSDDHSIVNNNSLKSIYQLLGRSGRVGVSSSSTIYVTGTELVNKITAQLHDQLDDGIHDEVKNIIDSIQRIV